jgi:hypothetical protein
MRTTNRRIKIDLPRFACYDVFVTNHFLTVVALMEPRA